MMSSSSSTIQRQDTTAVLHLNPTPEQTLRFDTSITLDDIPRPLPDPAQALTHEPATGDLVNSLFLPPPFALSWSDIEAIPPGNANPDMASKEDTSPSNSQTSHSDSGSADTEVTDSAYDMQYPSSPASAFTHFGSSDPSIHGSPEWHATSAPLPSQHQFSAHFEYTGAGIDPASLSPHTHSHTPISPSYTSSPLTLPLEYHASPEVQMSDLHMPVSPHPQYEEAAGVDAHGNFHPDANHRVYNSNGHAHPEPPAQYIHPSFLSAPAVYEYESRSTSKAGAGGELQDDERMELTSEPYPHFQPNSSSTHFVPENAIAPAAGSNPRAKKGKVATRGRKRKSLNSTATSNECAGGDDGKPASAKRRRSSSSSASSLQRPNSRRQRVIKQISDEEPKRPATTRVSRSAPSKAHTGPRRAHRGHQRSRYERGREEKQRRLNVRDDSVIVELNSDSDEDEGAVDDSECEYDTESSYIPSREVTPAVVPSATEAKGEVGKGKLHVLPHTGNIPAQTRKRSGCTKVSGSASASGSSASPPADNTSTQAPTALYALTYPYDFPGPAGLGSNTNTTTLSALATTDRRSRGIPLPVPVPNLTKKSRGRKVPALEVPVQLQLQLVDVVGRAGGLYGQRVSGESLESGPASVDGASRASSITGDLVQDGGSSGYPYPPQAPDMGENANTDANGGIAAAAIVAEDGGIEMGTTASGKKRTYLCRVPGCGKCFVRGEHLKRHVRSIHTYEKPHKCPYEGCGKSFSRRDNLGQHVRVHG